MPATIAALLRRADLGMTLLAGEATPQLTAPIRWVTTSELLDPTPYLRGDELLLTTGMRLKSAKRDVAQYVSRLATAGVLGVGIGVGHDLAYRRPPSRLVAAASERGLPLLLVDEPTPFIAIGEAVAQLHLADETAALAQALRGQQAITRAAVTGSSAAVVRRLAALLDGWVVVTDFDGQVRYEAPDGISAERPDWRAELERLRAGRGGAAALVAPGQHISIQSLGEARAPGERPLGFLVTGRPAPPSTAHHSMTNVAAALLAAGRGPGDGSAPLAATDGDSAAILDALSRYQRRSRVRLADSLRVWLAHHGRIEPAAQELGLHRNTLRYRITGAERLLRQEVGMNLSDPAARAAVWAAVSQGENYRI